MYFIGIHGDNWYLMNVIKDLAKRLNIVTALTSICNPRGVYIMISVLDYYTY
jgi:hypothetical protein